MIRTLLLIISTLLIFTNANAQTPTYCTQPSAYRSTSNANGTWGSTWTNNNSAPANTFLITHRVVYGSSLKPTAGSIIVIKNGGELVLNQLEIEASNIVFILDGGKLTVTQNIQIKSSTARFCATNGSCIGSGENFEVESGAQLYLANSGIKVTGGNLDNSGTITGSRIKVSVGQNLNNGSWSVSTIENWYAGGSNPSGWGAIPESSSSLDVCTCTPAATPTVTTAGASCVAPGTASISNYSSTNTYIFSPSGPTVSTGGSISGMVAGTSYTVRASNGCLSAASASFSINAQLSAPTNPPIIANYQTNGQTVYSEDISSYYIPCGSTTANLAVLSAENLPSGATLTWHTATSATDANRINPATAVTGATRKVYAAFRSSGGCYSPTKEIIVYAPICANDDDYSATPITAGVGGTLPSIFGNDTYNGTTITTAASGNVSFQYSQWTPTNGSINPATGVLTVPASTPPGIYLYSYQINDVDPDGVSGSNFSTATVLFRVVADSDGDGLHDEIDLDDDNDGILDKDECNIGFIANNVTGPWKGRTASNITVSASPSATQTNTQFITVDPQVNFSVNQNGGDQRFAGAATSATYVLTFSTPVPANEIALMIDDVNVAANQSPNASFKVDVDFGSGFTNPEGVFFKTMAGRNSGVSYNAITGVPTFQDLPNPVGEDIYLRGTGDRLVKAVRLTGTNLGTGDVIAYSFFALAKCDTDGDGIPNDLDLDSDGDGCFDAFEGDENVTPAHLNSNGSIRTNATGTANDNNIASVDANGVPLLVNAGGAADVGSDVGQGVGSSQNAAITPCCTNTAAPGIPDGYTQTGVSNLEGFANGWPKNVPNGFIAIESKNQGFVITRVSSSAAITAPVEGMLIYDIAAACVKLYNGTVWKCLAKDCK